MKNEKTPTRMGSVARQLTGKHASFIRFCKLFDIDLGKPFDKGSHITEKLSEHLFRFEIFARLYEMDYYKKKSIEIIANFLDREIDEVLSAIKHLKPHFFGENGLVKEEYVTLPTISSFEVDKYLGGNYDFLSYSEI